MAGNDNSGGDGAVAGAGAVEPQVLVEVNEQLVIAALQAQMLAEAAGKALNETSRLAEFDALTGLPNRLLLMDRFAQAIANARRRNVQLSVLFVDLDRFKPINDTLGHAIGDQVLQLVARCLSSAVRDADTVSRYGGDEFVILLPEISQAADAVRVINKINAALAASVDMQPAVPTVSASIGISIYPDDGAAADVLIECADAAMYSAKQHGAGSYAFHGQAPVGERSGGHPPSSRSPESRMRDQGYAGLQPAGEHSRRYADQREAIEQLLLAALHAQERQHAAEGQVRELVQRVSQLRGVQR